MREPTSILCVAPESQVDKTNAPGRLIAKCGALLLLDNRNVATLRLQLSAQRLEGVDGFALGGAGVYYQYPVFLEVDYLGERFF